MLLAEWERECQSARSVELGAFVGERVAGGCSLEVRSDAAGVLEIGYWLHPAFCGQGLATRAARLVSEAALAVPRVQAVEIRHDEANKASGGVPRRLGYPLVGTAPNAAPAPADSGIDLIWRLTSDSPFVRQRVEAVVVLEHCSSGGPVSLLARDACFPPLKRSRRSKL